MTTVKRKRAGKRTTAKGRPDRARPITASLAVAMENNRLAARVNYLETMLERAEKQLLQSRESKIRIPMTPAKRKSTKQSDTFCRIIIPDSHGSSIDPASAAAMLADIAVLCPTSIIMLGDHIDCGGFLAQHHTIGYVAQSEYTFEEDCHAANQFLDQIQAAAPHARIEYLEGNHERRIENWCTTQALKNKTEARFLSSLFSTASVLHLVKRGIEFYQQGKFYDGLRIPATIRRDGCYFTHGEYTSRNAAASHLAKYNANIWYAHTHRMDMATKRTVKDGLIGAWNPGCLCLLQPLWQHTNLTDWGHGYGLQLVRAGFGHLNLQIPIIDGVSYLEPLVSRSKTRAG